MRRFRLGSQIRTGSSRLAVVLGFLWALSGGEALGQAGQCVTDADCNDGQVCNGTEACVDQGGMMFCIGGMPVVCNDGDPCTSDFCVEPSGSCSSTASGDSDPPAGPDGFCNTADDNIDLFGPDGACGTMDDVVGDGVCDLVDNCDLAFNPGQEDADGDLLGDACDRTPCLVRSLYAFSGSSLYRVDPATGDSIFLLSGFSSPREVSVDSTEMTALVTGGSPERIYFVNLTTRMIFQTFDFPMNDPRGVDFGSSTGDFYVALRANGQIIRVDASGAGVFFTVTSSLTTPVGLDVNAAETTAYVSEETAGEVSSVNLTTGTIATIAPMLQSPRALVLDPTETYLFVIEAGLNRLTRVQISNGALTTITSSLVNPEGLTLNAAGTIAYVVESSQGFSGISAVDLATGTITPLHQGPMSGQVFNFNGGLELSPRPPAVLSQEEFLSGLQSFFVLVPVNVDDVTGLDVLSADFTVDFNPSIITATTVGPGSLTSSCTVTGNLMTPGRAVISVFCTSPLSGQGSIAEIGVNIMGTPGKGTPLDLVSVLLNEGTPPVCGDDGGFVVPVDIAGRVVYYRDHLTSTEPSAKPVDAVVLTLERIEDVDQDGMLEIVSNVQANECDGDYAFLSQSPPVREYQVTPQKTDDFESAIDPFDAALNAQHVVGLITLTANQRLAADVTGNNVLTSFDSARIAQFSVGLITQFQVAVVNGSDWTFVPAPQTEPNQVVQNPYPPGAQPGRIRYVPIVESAENQDFRGILYGDVSGNWTQTCGVPMGGSSALGTGRGRTEPEGAGTAQSVATASGLLSLPSLRAAPGEIVRVPIRAEGTGGAISFYLDVRYDPAVLRLVGTERGAAAGSFNLTVNTAEAGRGRLALFSANPLGLDGEVAAMTFEVVGKIGARSAITLTNPTVNEGRIPVSVQDGKVLVLPRPAQR